MSRRAERAGGFARDVVEDVVGQVLLGAAGLLAAGAVVAVSALVGGALGGKDGQLAGFLLGLAAVIAVGAVIGAVSTALGIVGLVVAVLASAVRGVRSPQRTAVEREDAR